jgi:hypothetical protein
MKDYVYYLWVNGQMLMVPFANEEEAKQYAEEKGLENYEIEPWEVD